MGVMGLMGLMGLMGWMGRFTLHFPRFTLHFPRFTLSSPQFHVVGLWRGGRGGCFWWRRGGWCIWCIEVVFPTAVSEVALSVHHGDASALAVLAVGLDATESSVAVGSRQAQKGSFGCDAVALQSVGIPEGLKVNLYFHCSYYYLYGVKEERRKKSLKTPILLYSVENND